MHALDCMRAYTLAYTWLFVCVIPEFGSACAGFVVLDFGVSAFEDNGCTVFTGTFGAGSTVLGGWVYFIGSDSWGGFVYFIGSDSWGGWVYFIGSESCGGFVYFIGSDSLGGCVYFIGSEVFVGDAGWVALGVDFGSGNLCVTLAAFLGWWTSLAGVGVLSRLLLAL